MILSIEVLPKWHITISCGLAMFGLLRISARTLVCESFKDLSPTLSPTSLMKLNGMVTVTARPVYVSLEEHIKAHFLTCFLALLFVRITEAKLDYKYSTNQIITSLRKIQFTDIDVGYISSYKMTPCIQSLVDTFKIECDYNSYTPIQMRKVINSSKNESFTTTK